MTNEKLEARAVQVLRETGTYRIPVPIDVVAHRLRLTTKAAALGDDVSGMLVVEDELGAIGYNSTHAPVRQRFTIAHEIAHYILHLKKNQKSQLFIDRFVFRRDEKSSTGSDHEEVEANRFAAALLMPETFVRKVIERLDIDLDDSDGIDTLAKQFNVSTAAMTNRLSTLGLLR